MRGNGILIGDPDDILYGDLGRASVRSAGTRPVKSKYWWPQVQTPSELSLFEQYSYWGDCRGYAGWIDWGIRSDKLPEQLIADRRFDRIDADDDAEARVKFLIDAAGRKDLSEAKISSLVAPGLLELVSEAAPTERPLLTRASRAAILEDASGIEGEWRYISGLMPHEGMPSQFLLYVDVDAEQPSLLAYLML